MQKNQSRCPARHARVRVRRPSRSYDGGPLAPTGQSAGELLRQRFGQRWPSGARLLVGRHCDAAAILPVQARLAARPFLLLHSSGDARFAARARPGPGRRLRRPTGMLSGIPEGRTAHRDSKSTVPRLHLEAWGCYVPFNKKNCYKHKYHDCNIADIYVFKLY